MLTKIIMEENEKAISSLKFTLDTYKEYKPWEQILYVGTLQSLDIKSIFLSLYLLYFCT